MKKLEQIESQKRAVNKLVESLKDDFYVRKASVHYGKSIDDVIKAIKCRISVIRKGKVTLAKIDFLDTDSGIRIRDSRVDIIK